MKNDAEIIDETASLSSRRPLPHLKEGGLVLVVLALGILLTTYGYYDSPPGYPNTFLNFNNIIDQIATPMSYYAIMAVGMTFVIITGGIDISVGSMMALGALAAAEVLEHLRFDSSRAVAIPIALLVAVGIGALCGLLNGLLIVGLRLHPFIVTLGTLSIYRCIAIVAPPIQTLPETGRDLPAAFTVGFMKAKFHGFEAVPMLIMLSVVAAGWFYLSLTVGGRQAYAVGGNEQAARFSGVRVNRVKLRVYIVAGITAGLAGMVSLGHFGTASTSTAYGYELTVVAAAVVGGASLSGGRGTALGALLGTLVIAMIENGIDILHLPQEYRLGVIGAAIIVAAALDQFGEYLRRRRAARVRKT